MKAFRRLAQVGAAALIVAAALTACGPDQATATGPGGIAASSAQNSGSTAAGDPATLGKGGDAWCQSIVALSTFLMDPSGVGAAAGQPVADGANKKQRLLALVADMEAKAPPGHEADFAIFNELYAIWADLYVNPDAGKAKQLQDMARSDRVTQAQARVKPDILAACPNLTNAGF